MLQSVKIVLYILMVAVSLGGSAGANYPVGDLNEDRRVDLEDLQVLAGQWLDESCLILDCEADLDGANGINTVDFALLAENWGGKGTALVMSEFMASNSKTLLDENDDSSDWIEIYNPTDEVVDLSGWYLTDDVGNLTQWKFPDGAQSAAGGFLIVFASGKNRAVAGSQLHTNFNLNIDGEYLALVNNDGITTAYEYAPKYPKQLTDISYGLAQYTTTLVPIGTNASYRVPNISDEDADWTALGFDDSAWISEIGLGPARLVITEIETGQTDWVEIQNVSDQDIDTSGWIVALNDASSGDVSNVHSVVWNLPASISPGQVLYKTDDPGDHYWGSDILWEEDIGWAMIIDDNGNVADLLVWGYDKTEIASLKVDAGGLHNVTVANQWSYTSQTVTIDRWNTDNPGDDIGNPSVAGSYAYYAAEDTFIVHGGGRDIWSNSDQFYYVYQSLSGDGQITTRVNSIDNTNAWAKAGVMIRESLDADSKNALVDVTAANGVSFQRRRSTGGGGYHNTIGGLSAPYWVKLVRQGETFIGYMSANGNSWTLIASDTIPMVENVYVGLAVTAHNDAGPLCKAEFQNVSVSHADPATTVARTGNSDHNTAEDFVSTKTQSKGTQNPGLSWPFVGGDLPVTTGIGFGNDQPDFDNIIRTDVAQVMHGVNASLWARIGFEAEQTDFFDSLSLRVKYEDGFVAYLNGVEVARDNFTGTPVWNSAADSDRSNEQAAEFVQFDISEHTSSLREGRNVLAIHALNDDKADEDFLILPELVARADRGRPQYMVTPTPEKENVPGALGLVADTRFSVDRGFFTGPFEVEITTATEGAVIYYTLDGTEPYQTGGRFPTGTVYTGPIPIAKTTCLRALATKPGYQQTNVDTHTYIFPADVARQSTMSTTITYDPVWGPQLQDALLELPTVSLVTPHSISEAERETSIELIFPDGSAGFQVDAGVELFGGTSLGHAKKSMRISFKSIYGPSILRYDLFGSCSFGGSDATDEFDQILLRSGSHDAMYWTQPGTSAKGIFIRNRWIFDRQLEMGQPAPRGRFVHLYINGVYWGQYHLMERPNAPFMASYFGGNKEDYDAVKGDYGSLHVLNGEATAWYAMIGSTSDYQALQQYMDVTNYADYLLVNFYVGNDWDWRTYQNWLAARKRQPGAGYKFFCWDNDVILRTGLNANVVNRGGPGNIWSSVKQHEEFRMLLADRAQKYFFTNGMLTRDRVLAQLDELAGQIEMTVIPECARWGIPQSYTPSTWQQALDWVKTEMVDQRTEVVIQQMRDAGLFPSIDAPVFSQQGGYISAGDSISITSTTGTIYYTLDGSDPHLPETSGGGTISSTTLVTEDADKRVLVPTGPVSSGWKGGGAFDDSAWTLSTGPPRRGGVGYERGSGYESLLNIDIGDQMYGKNATCYIRIPFTVNADDLADFNFMTLEIRYDDAFVAYINGVEVDRRNFTGTPQWDSAATSGHDDSAAVMFESVGISDHINALRAGTNVLAIHGLNVSTTSSDLLISLKLVAGETSSPGGGGISPTAMKYTAPIILTETTHVKARVLSGSTWSALNEAIFAIGPVAENLRITEIMYHPQDTNDPNDPNEEFIELQNIGIEAINLNLVRFTNGVDFTFPSMGLAAGEYVLVVKDVNAFAAQYGLGLNIAGQYSGNLRNGGERIELQDAAGQTILNFRYRDGWYDITDGMGFSLTAKDPVNTEPNAWNDKSTWRPSANIGGSPGWDDAGEIPELGDVVINELLAHSHAGAPDWIELHNSTSWPIHIGGWFLSDSQDNLMKYEIAEETWIDPRDYIVFYENEDFGNWNDPACHVPFALSENGETLYVHSGRDGVLTGYSDEEKFGASETGVAFGRYRKSTGTYNFVAMSENTAGSANAYPKVGPIVINEIMYHPQNNGDAEYVELLNISGGSLTLQEWDDIQSEFVPWRFTDEGGISFDFPLGTTMAAGEHILLVRNLSAFESEFGAVGGSVQIFEWELGKLDNAGEKIELSKPGDEVDGERYYIRVDRVNYSDGSHPLGEDPWPAEADGNNLSLARRIPGNYGNDVINWKAASPSPGAVNP